MPTGELLLEVLTLAFAGGGAAVAGAIRSDLKHIAHRLQRVEDSTARAHERIDEVILDRRREPRS
jgi:hypothetical protein